MNKTVGLALSGGALRGVFHLGVMKALEELAIEVSVMSGTSSGAIVGVLYANGHTPEEILKLTTDSSFLKMLNLRTWKGGLLSLRYLKKMLKKNLTVDNLEDLERPVLVTATNLLSGEVETFETGGIIERVIASSSIPIMFSPVELNGQLYIDGGIGMNLPASPIRERCDVVIGSNLAPLISVEREDVSSLIKQAGRTFDLIVLNNIRPELEVCDIEVTTPELSQVGRFDFDNMTDLFDMGYDATMELQDELHDLINE